MSDLFKTVTAMNIADMEESIKPIKRIYIDLNMIHEINIGALLLHTTTEEEYNLIKAAIPKYSSRIDTHICSHFGDLNITDEDIFNFQQNKDNAERLFKASPTTNLMHQFPIILEDITKHNGITNTVHSIDIIINTYPIVFPSNICKFMSAMWKKISRSITFNTITKPHWELADSTIMSIDRFYVNDIYPWIGYDDRMRDLFCDKKIYDNKEFVTRKVKQDDTDHVDNIAHMFDTTEAMCNLFCNFSYMDIIIPPEYTGS